MKSFEVTNKLFDNNNLSIINVHLIHKLYQINMTSLL
jgi:hypothetical protein